MDYSTPMSVKIALGCLAGLITLIGYLFGDIDAGFLLGGGIPIVLLAAWTRRDLRHQAAFWFLIASWIFVDIMLVLTLRPTLYFHPAILFVPFFIIDYILVLGSFFVLERAVIR